MLVEDDPKRRSSFERRHLEILGRRHLELILREFVMHYNASRPHRGLELAVPEASTTEVIGDGAVRCRARLGGLIHEYIRETA